MGEAYRQLFIFVEGQRDADFVEKVIIGAFKGQYDCINIIKYASQKYKWRKDFINSIQSMGAEYLYLADINSMPCVSKKKEKIINEIPNIDISRLMIVKQEIESWIIAGIDSSKIMNIGKILQDTEIIGKELFEEIAIGKYGSIVDFMSEIFKYYSVGSAIARNKSLDYFIKKYFGGLN